MAYTWFVFRNSFQISITRNLYFTEDPWNRRLAVFYRIRILRLVLDERQSSSLGFVKCIAKFCIPKAAFYTATERTTSLQKRKTQQTQNHLQYQIPASRSEGTQHSVFYTTIALTALFRHESSFSTRHIEGREKLQVGGRGDRDPAPISSICFSEKYAISLPSFCPPSNLFHSSRPETYLHKILKIQFLLATQHTASPFRREAG